MLKHIKEIPKKKLFIAGKLVESKTKKWINLCDPATNDVIALVPRATESEMEDAVVSCKEAFKIWSRTSVLHRQAVMLNYRQLVMENIDNIASSIAFEMGKTHPDAKKDVLLGLRNVDYCCGIPSLLMGETLSCVSKDMDTTSYRLPLGVTASILPNNYGAAIPLCVYPTSAVCGNAHVMKPSKHTSGSVLQRAQLAKTAGFPSGAFNVFHGERDALHFICDNKDIKSISFLGSDEVGGYIYARGAKTGKRIQAGLAAKNHGVIMPDADKDNTLKGVIKGAFGESGQRCMAMSTVVFVGEAKYWIPELVERCKQLKVNAGNQLLHSSKDSDVNVVAT